MRVLRPTGSGSPTAFRDFRRCCCFCFFRCRRRYGWHRAHQSIGAEARCNSNVSSLLTLLESSPCAERELSGGGPGRQFDTAFRVCSILTFDAVQQQGSATASTQAELLCILACYCCSEPSSFVWAAKAAIPSSPCFGAGTKGKPGCSAEASVRCTVGCTAVVGRGTLERQLRYRLLRYKDKHLRKPRAAAAAARRHTGQLGQAGREH